MAHLRYPTREARLIPPLGRSRAGVEPEQRERGAPVAYRTEHCERQRVLRAGVLKRPTHGHLAALSESVPTGRDGLFVSTATPMARARVVTSWKPKSPPVLLCARGSGPVCDFPRIRVKGTP